MSHLTIRNFHFLLAASFTLIGLAGFVPFSWLQPQHLLFGLLATAPLLNLALIGFGICLAISLYLAAKVDLVWPHRRLSQTISLFYAVLAIGGFISLPIWPNMWLNLLANSLASDILYMVLATYFGYLGFFHQTNAAQVVERSPLTPPPPAKDQPSPAVVHPDL